MKATMMPMNYVKLTVALDCGRASSKKVRTAEQAAKHYTDMRNHSWWNAAGSKLPRPAAYEMWTARDQKLYRRVLPIFQKYLP